MQGQNLLHLRVGAAQVVRLLALRVPQPPTFSPYFRVLWLLLERFCNLSLLKYLKNFLTP